MRVLIADDHPLYREAVSTQVRRLYPEAQVDERHTLDHLSTDPNSEPYDLILLDFHMPGMSAGALETLCGHYPHVPIAVISGTANRADIRAVIRAGARGFIPKTSTPEQLAHAMQMLLAGGTSVPAELLMADAETPDGHEGTPWVALLTPRELEVLKAVSRGLPNKQIARELSLAEVTVKLHLRAIFRKIGARTRSEAAVMATKAGLN